jgi:ribosomal protein S11
LSSISSIFIRNRFYHKKKPKLYFRYYIRRRFPRRFRRKQILRRRTFVKGMTRLKRRIKFKFFKTCYTFKRRPKKRKECRRKSFFNKYISCKKIRRYKRKRKKAIKCKRVTLYKRTKGLKIAPIINFQAENKIFYMVHDNILRIEKNRMRNNSLSQNTHKLLSNRYFCLRKVYFTHRRRNTFITISAAPTDITNSIETVIFKSSCGHQGYKGPKRKTYHARLSVAQAAGEFLASKEVSSLDIIFPSGFGRIFYRLVKDLCRSHFYVRYFISKQQRSHGHTRKRKLRRL